MGERQAVGGGETDAQAREAAWADSDRYRIEVGEAEAGPVERFMRGGQELARMRGWTGQCADRGNDLVRVAVDEDARRARRGRAVEAEEVQRGSSISISRLSPPVWAMVTRAVVSGTTPAVAAGHSTKPMRRGVR